MTMNGSGPLVESENLKVYFPIKSGLVLDRHVGDIRAVDDISLTIKRGEPVGRVGLARALGGKPAVVVAAEPVSGLDGWIQAQLITLLEQLPDQFDLTYLFIAHYLAVVRHIADRIAVMYLGWIVEVSPAAELYENPLHPYTISLLSAVPIPDPVVERQRESILLAGDLPSPTDPPPACRFHTRCPYVQPTRCRDEVPPLRTLASGHQVACHWAEQIRDGQLTPHERAPVLVHAPEAEIAGP